MAQLKTALLIALASAAACALPVMSAAQGQAGTEGSRATAAPSFEDLDTNHDGKLVRSEMPRDVDALKPLRAHFREADLDGNGSLSKEEYQRYLSSNVRPGV